MKHFEEDILLKYAMELLDDEGKTDLQKHLAKCDKCRDSYETIKQQIALIGSVEPDVQPEHIPLPQKKVIFNKQWIKAAAILLIGFFIGYFTSNFTQTGKVDVVRQNLITKTILYPVHSFRACEQVDLNAKY